MFDIVIRYGNGRRSAVRSSVDDLGEACAQVLKLADELGHSADEGDDSPKWIEILREDHLEISVSVVTGGLRPKGG